VSYEGVEGVEGIEGIEGVEGVEDADVVCCCDARAGCSLAFWSAAVQAKLIAIWV
jgi:hypothetical protein